MRRESGLITLIERQSAITIEPFAYGAITVCARRSGAYPAATRTTCPPAPTLLKQRLKPAGQQWILGSWHNRLELPAPPPCSPANGYERQRPCSAPPKGSCRSISAGRTGGPGRRNPRPFQPGAAGRSRPQLRPPPAPAGRTPGTGQRPFPAAPLRRPALEQQLPQRPGRPASLPGTAEPPLRPRNNPPLRQPVAAAVAGPATSSPPDSRPEPGAANRRRRSRNGSQLYHLPKSAGGKRTRWTAGPETPLPRPAKGILGATATPEGGGGSKPRRVSGPPGSPPVNRYRRSVRKNEELSPSGPGRNADTPLAWDHKDFLSR